MRLYVDNFRTIKDDISKNLVALRRRKKQKEREKGGREGMEKGKKRERISIYLEKLPRATNPINAAVPHIFSADRLP